MIVTCAGPLAATAAAVNNDGFMLPLSGIALVLSRGSSSRAPTCPAAVGLGTVVALGLLTKGQFVLVAVAGCLALLVPERREPRWWHPLAAYLVVGGVGGLWWWRVFVDTHGFTPSGSELLAPPAPGPWQGASYPGYVLERLPDVFGRLPGWYGWKLAILPSWLLIPVQVGIVGIAVLWVVCRRWQRPTREGLRLLVLPALPVMLLMSSAYTAYDTYRYNGDQHGLAPRYLYGMAPLLAVGAVGAIAAIVRAPRAAADPGHRRSAAVRRHGGVRDRGVVPGGPAGGVLHLQRVDRVPAGRGRGTGGAPEGVAPRARGHVGHTARARRADARLDRLTPASA